jgi:hypothetical protein
VVGVDQRGYNLQMARGRVWTPEEDEYLIENYKELGRKACADHLGRPVNGVKCRAYELGIQADVAWTDREDKLLREKYPEIGRTGCAELIPGRSVAAVGARAGLLGLTSDKRRALTLEVIKVIRESYQQRGGRRICAQLLPHLTPCAISHAAERLSVLQRERKQWTDEEDQFLRLNYPNKGKVWCARQLPCRTAGALAARARTLDLTVDPSGEYFKEWQGRAAASKVGRSKPGQRELMADLWKKRRLPQPDFTSERRQKQSETMRAWHLRHGNPNKGKSLSCEVKLKMSAASRRMWSDPGYRAKMTSPERRERRRQASSDAWFRSGRLSENAYSRCNGGRREDLGDMFFRSGWEANYARILNLQLAQGEIYRWEFESEKFRFPPGVGRRLYCPDFKVWTHKDGDCHYIEIKGWMDEMSRLKLQLMERFYPGVPLLIIGPKEYRQLQQDFSPRIEKWEFYSSRYVAKRKVV